MEHYAAILNLEDADSYCLQQDELFDHEVQGTVSRSILLGHGQTEHAALTVALNTLQDNGMLKTYKCEFGADGILKSGSGREALRHLWLYDKKNGTSPRLYPLPGHSSAVAFCRKYNLSEEATEELFILVSSLLDLDE